MITCFDILCSGNHTVFIMNKKIGLIILLISSLFFSIFFQERASKDIQALKIETVLEKLTDKQRYEFSIFKSDKANIQLFHNAFIELAKQNKITVKTGYDRYLDDGNKRISNYIYDPDNLYFQFIKDQFEYNGQTIDFSNEKSSQYISTDLEAKAQGYIKLFDKQYLRNNKLIYELKGIGDFVQQFQAIDNNINYYIYTNDNDDIEKIKQLLQSQFTEGQYETSENLISSHNEESNLSLNNNYIILCFFSFLFIICMLYMFYSKYREMMIVNLLGYRQTSIFKNYFLKEVILCLALLMSSLSIYFIVFVSRINEYTMSFLLNLINFFNVFVFAFIVFIILFIAYIYKTKKYRDLSRGRSLHRLIYIQLISKIIFMVIFTLFIISNIIPNYPYYEAVITYYKQKDIIDNIYDIKNIKNDKRTSQILSQNSAIGCDFTDILLNSHKEGYIPYIIVNQEYLSLYNIDIGSSQSTLIVPNQYKNIDLSSYKHNSNVQIDYTEKQYTFYDPSLSIATPIKCPIVLVANEEYNYPPYSIYLKNDKSIAYYKSLLSSVMSEDQIEIQQNKTYIEMVLREKVYPNILDNSLFTIIYFLTYCLILELLLSTYIKNKEKELSLKKIHGYAYIYLYKDIFLSNIFTFVIPLIISFKFNMFQDMFIYFMFILFVDIFYIAYRTYYLKINIELLKEV